MTDSEVFAMTGGVVELHHDRGTRWSARTCERVCRHHGIDPASMFRDLGERSSYAASEILLWLGY